MNDQSPSNANPIQLELAGPDDLGTFLHLARLFFEESEQAKHVTFSEHALATTFLTTFPNRQTNQPAKMHTVIVYVWTGPDTRVPAGFVSVTFDRSHTVEPVASIHLIYALPETRKTQIGRMLMNAAVRLAEYEKAPIIMAGAITGVSSKIGTVNNLFRKFGFEESGHCFVKFMEGEVSCASEEAVVPVKPR